MRCPDEEKAKEMEALIMDVKGKGDTVGGVVTCVIKGCPVGLGEPEFGKLNAQLGGAMLSINAVKGFEIGDGFDIVSHHGSEVNDIHAGRAEVEPLRRHSRWHLQWCRHLLPRGFQACGYAPYAATDD